MNDILKIFLILFTAISCNSIDKGNHKISKEFHKDSMRISLSENKKIKNEVELINDFTPNFKCIRLSEQPIDTIYSKSDKVQAFLYEIFKDSIDPICLKYFYSNVSSDAIVDPVDTGDFWYDSLGNALMIKTSKSIDTFSNYECECEGATRYRVVHYYDFINSYLIEVAGWESVGFIVIDRNSGRQSYYRAFPQYNRSKTMFLINTSNDADGYFGLSVYTSDKTHTERIWSYKGEISKAETITSPLKTIWITDSSFIFRDSDLNRGFKDRFYIIKINNAP